MSAQISFLTSAGDIDGAVLRDQGIAQVAENNQSWMDSTVPVLRRYCETHSELTGESFRWWYLNAGGMPPKSHYAWGSLFTIAAKRGLIEKTGRYTAATSAKTHCHPVTIWASQVFRGQS